MSAKMRLALWVTSMVLILSAMVLTFVLVINRNTLPEDPKRYLVDVVLENANDLEYDNGRLEWDDLHVYRRGIYCSFYNDDGELLLSGNTEEMDFSEYEFEDNVTRMVTVDGVEYFIYDKYVDMSIAGLWIRGATRTDSRFGIMDTILRLTLVLLPLILIVTFIGALLISSRTFKPMEQIVATANSINDADDLTDRINLKRGPREMKKLAKSFDRMFERLEKLFDAERQFTSDASHELRTPTAVILAECERAKRKELSNEEYKETIEHIEEQGKRMTQLIDELLGITRLQQGTEKYPLTNSNLSEFVSLCAEDFELSLTSETDRGIHFESDIQDGIEASFNASLISRVVYNLLQNAYKYGRDNGNVKISLKTVDVLDADDSKETDGKKDKSKKNKKSKDKNRDVSETFAVLSVSDDGIGISEENMDKIWNRFWQADNSRGEEGGSGLGLSMVKGIAELHKGNVSVESKEGQGSTFNFRIPV